MYDRPIDLVFASNALLRRLESGRRFPGAPHLIKGVPRLAKQRRYGIARRLEGCCIGLPLDLPFRFYLPVPEHLTRVALPDYETLEWHLFLFQSIGGVTLPVVSVGVPIEHGGAAQTRALLGVSQTWLDRNKDAVYRDPSRDVVLRAMGCSGNGIVVPHAVREIIDNPGPLLVRKLRGVCWNHSSGPFTFRPGLP